MQHRHPPLLRHLAELALGRLQPQRPAQGQGQQQQQLQQAEWGPRPDAAAGEAGGRERSSQADEAAGPARRALLPRMSTQVERGRP